MRITVLESEQDVALATARMVGEALRRHADLMLGLPTGRTPVAAYAELRRMHARGEADFSRASTFNLDEFAGVAPTDPGSFRQFMQRHLFAAVNLDPSRIHFLDGAAADLDAECVRYEAALRETGGVDLQLLGIGANGHIGFNEPGDELQAATHRVTLLPGTRRDNAAQFGGEPERVPREALTMGVGSILMAKRIVLVATGQRKAACIERSVRGPLTTRLPASLLQLHRDVEFLIDRAAASAL